MELVPGGQIPRVDLGDRVEHDLPALEEERVEDLLLRLEVVVHEAVGDARLVRDIGDAAVMEAAVSEHADGRVEYETTLVRCTLSVRGHQTTTPSGQW